MKMDLILIEWVDSHIGRGWRDLKDIEAASTNLHCDSVGWLLSKTVDCVTILPHIYSSKNGSIVIQACGEMTIPRRAITKMTILRKAKK